MDATSLWKNLRLLAEQPDEGRTGLWAWLQERFDVAMARPQAVPGVIASRLDGRDGPYTVIKNPATKTYYQLSDRDAFLWELMDGSRTVKDLVVAYFGQYGSFAFGRVAGLVTGLRANGFLTDKPVGVYRLVHESLEGRRLRVRLGRIWHAFLQTPLAIGGLDGALDRVYKGAGWLLFTRPAQILYVVLSLLGVVLYGQLFISGRYSLVSEAGAYGLGLVMLIAAQFVAVFLHELAHALTVKHYRREVRRAGVMIYFGMPAFFVDTTDMWLEGKRARLAVTWAGPYSGLILAGLVTLVMAAWPALPLESLAVQVRLYLLYPGFHQPQPPAGAGRLLPAHGLARISQLRRKSMEFLRIGLPAKAREMWLTRRAQPQQAAWLTAEERIFVVFGLLAAAWTIYAVCRGPGFLADAPRAGRTQPVGSWNRTRTLGAGAAWDRDQRLVCGRPGRDPIPAGPGLGGHGPAARPVSQPLARGSAAPSRERPPGGPAGAAGLPDRCTSGGGSRADRCNLVRLAKRPRLCGLTLLGRLHRLGSIHPRARVRPSSLDSLSPWGCGAIFRRPSVYWAAPGCCWGPRCCLPAPTCGRQGRLKRWPWDLASRQATACSLRSCRAGGRGATPRHTWR